MGNSKAVKQQYDKQENLFDKEKFKGKFKRKREDLQIRNKESLEDYLQTLKESYRASCLSLNGIQDMQYLTWWKLEIETKGNECTEIRRLLTCRRVRVIQNHLGIEQ